MLLRWCLEQLCRLQFIPPYLPLWLPYNQAILTYIAVCTVLGPIDSLPHAKGLECAPYGNPAIALIKFPPGLFNQWYVVIITFHTVDTGLGPEGSVTQDKYLEACSAQC